MTPPLNAKGVYTVNLPFQLVANTLYTCKAIRTYADLIDSGVDVYGVYYQPNNLTQQQYQADLTAGASIITLMSDTSPTVHVPDTYIVAFPSMDNIPYSEVILALSLGPLPDKLDLSFAIQQIQDAASNTVGVTPTVTTYLVPVTGVMTQAQSDAAETARQAAITNRTSDYAALLALRQQYATLQSNYTTLSQLAISKGILNPPSPTPTPSPSPHPTPSFKSAVVQNGTVSFQDTSVDSNTIQGWSWDFGDGQGTSHLQNPVYTYLASGTYSAVLTITDSTGDYSSVPVAITVAVPPPTPTPTP
jgi:PKD repeat protein